MGKITKALAITMLLCAFAPHTAKADTAEMAISVGKQLMGRGFNDVEKSIIDEYFASKNIEDSDHKGKKHKNKSKGKSKSLPPGLAKKDTLPSGLAKQLEKNGTLPPGLAKRDLPSDLLSRLPAPHKGTKRVIVGDDVVLIEKGTEMVVDILKGVLSK